MIKLRQKSRGPKRVVLLFVGDLPPKVEGIGRMAELALDTAYKERRARPRQRSAARMVQVWSYIREAIAEKRARDAVAKYQTTLELPEALRSE